MVQSWKKAKVDSWKRQENDEGNGRGMVVKMADNKTTVETDLRLVLYEMEMEKKLVYVGEYLGEGEGVDETDCADEGELFVWIDDGGRLGQKRGLFGEDHVRTQVQATTMSNNQIPILVAPRPVRLSVPFFSPEKIPFNVPDSLTSPSSRSVSLFFFFSHHHSTSHSQIRFALRGSRRIPLNPRRP